MSSWSSLESGGKGGIRRGTSSKLDRFVREADERGIKVLTHASRVAVLGVERLDSLTSGLRATAGGTVAQIHMYPPSDPQDYADVAHWITARYGTKLAALEVWNEPNLEEDRFWIAPDEPRAYADLLKATYSAAKAGDPGVPVLAGALAYGNDAWVRALTPTRSWATTTASRSIRTTWAPARRKVVGTRMGAPAPARGRRQGAAVGDGVRLEHLPYGQRLVCEAGGSGTRHQGRLRRAPERAQGGGRDRLQPARQGHELREHGGQLRTREA